MQSVLPDRDVPVRDAPVRDVSVFAEGTGALLGRIGSLEVRLAEDEAEVRAAQELRYSVFYDELGATKSAGHMAERRDVDRFDAVCDHLVVVDRQASAIVGTYRLLRQDAAGAAGGFYSGGEFEIGALVARHPRLRFLELGRSCVLPQYRSKRTIELLWQGIWTYLTRHGVDVMAGCASFQGTDPADHAQALTYLARTCRAPAQWDVRAIGGRYHPMDLLPPDALDARAAMAALPPLVKGYLRVGARVGDGCVVDHDFGTVDVFLVMPVRDIAARYVSYYGSEHGRFAA